MKRKLLLLAAACIATVTSTVYGATEEKLSVILWKNTTWLLR